MSSDKKQFNNPFPYHVGVSSLEEMANKSSRVCVMNILGGESSKVTPVSHEYSGGNIVCGVQYGRGGSKLETAKGDIPVYGSIKEAVEDGKQFDTGVVYLPPSAVYHAVAELTDDAHRQILNKVIVLTEKVSVKDGRYIRWLGQQKKVDVFGANSLGIANSWDQVRLGGALGGDKPHESLKKGSVAIYSNSGNFSTTISEYLKTAGCGTSTILSSGKDVYIHFALPEFLFAAENDPRTKAVVVYIEPGGYYEKMALDWIQQGLFKFTKPIVAIVTGRWKSNLTRSCGHAGALAGSGDDAIAKENWFDSYFGVGVFDPRKPDVSERGVRVVNIQQVPEAIAAIYKKLGYQSDFAPIGDLSLKPWFENKQGLKFPVALDLKSVTAIAPYDEEIKKANRMVGAQVIRENMRNRSGASMMNSESQVTEVHGKSVLELVEYPFGGTALFSVIKEMPAPEAMPVVNAILNIMTGLGTSHIDTAVRARKNGASPNAYIGAAVLESGYNKLQRDLQTLTEELIENFYDEIHANLAVNAEVVKKKLDVSLVKDAAASAADEKTALWLSDLIAKKGQETVFTSFARQYNEKHKADKEKTNPLHLVMAAALLSISWKTLIGRQITRKDAVDLGVYLSVNGIIVANSALGHESNAFWQKLKALDTSVLESDFTSTCFQVLFNRLPEAAETFALNALLNLTVSNGPGTISAKGAKESVSAKNYINTAFVGFMTNTGFAHGGNGFEAIDFLIKEFKEYNPYQHSGSELDKTLAGISTRVSSAYAEYKKKAKSAEGTVMKIPCINHPVFKDKPVNIDPREDFVRRLFKEKGMVNPFLEFYHKLVVDLFEKGATKNVFCVNIDAVIATVSLELFWKDMQAGKIAEAEMQDIVFTLFLFGRMVGTSAEVADHLNRGTDMDCRTPASQITFAR